MKKLIKYILVSIMVLVIGVGGYIVFLFGYFFYHGSTQMKAGHQCMDSITEKDIPVWIERSRKFMEKYDPNGSYRDPNRFYINVYGFSSEGKPVPDELRKLKIVNVVVEENRVIYVWLGGMSHTSLYVDRDNQGNFEITGEYNDGDIRIIWKDEEYQEDEYYNKFP